MTPKAKSCTYCCGYGVWSEGRDDFIPVTEADAKGTRYPTLPCPLCQSINTFVIEKYGLVERPGPFQSADGPIAKKADDFFSSLKKFEERIRCVESSDSQETSQAREAPLTSW